MEHDDYFRWRPAYQQISSQHPQLLPLQPLMWYKTLQMQVMVLLCVYVIDVNTIKYMKVITILNLIVPSLR
jgi:hypothetical protein